MAKLTEMKVREAKPTDKDRWLNDGGGLYLRIRKSGSKKWIIRRKKNDKTQIITLGDYPSLSLKAARLKAGEFSMKKDISSVTVTEPAKKYMRKVVEPTHRRADLVQGYTNHLVRSPDGAIRVLYNQQVTMPALCHNESQ